MTDREQFFADIIVTAVEGGIGYWSVVDHYQVAEPGMLHIVVDGGHIGRGTFAVVREMGDGEDPGGISVDGPPLTLDVNGIGRAFEMAMSGEDHVPEEDVERMTRAYVWLDAGLLDADDADVLAQLAVLDGVIYR